MTEPLVRIAITPGEPAGIGPDLCIQLAQQPWPVELVAIADPDLLKSRATTLDLPLQVREFAANAPPRPAAAGELSVLPVALAHGVRPGTPHPGNAPTVLATLDAAIAGCRDKTFAALATGPVHKGVINDAGIPFSGHTEYLAARSDDAFPVMLLACPEMRVALATTHLPLRAVPDAITPERLQQVLTVLHTDLQNRFGISQPRILVLGLNPHAGESGHLGREEIEIITPVLKQLRAQGLHIGGPLPADTAFTPRLLAQADAVLAMYHDQGLPVLKHAGFGTAVNITLGLPIIRTSVDHGTALELAGTGRAETGSMKAALEMAIELAARQTTV